MQTYLDSEPFNTDAATLGALIAAVREHLGDTGKNRIIVEVREDGRTLSADELEQRHDEQLTAEELQLITANPQELARQTMLDVADALAATRDEQRRAAELLRDGEAQAAMDHVKTALTVWTQVQRSVLESAQLLGIALDTVQVGGRGVPELVESLAEQLRAVRDQLTAQDWLGLADAMEYDLDEQAEHWAALIQTLSDQIRESRDRP